MNLTKNIVKDLIKSGAKAPDDLASFKRKMAKKYKISCLDNISLLKSYHDLTNKGNIKKSPIIEGLLISRPIRSLSGIVNISVLTKPYPCPGECIYCPSEKGIPKSYLSGEPAVERAKKLNYDPYLQVKKRIEMLKAEGHPTDKIELRVVGGTWSFYPKKYQEWFIKKCFDACNKKNGKDLKKAQDLNEKAKHRIIGLSVETRPDFIDNNEIERLRNLGATMIELGVQSIYDNVLKLNKRNHNVDATIEATKLLKDAGFKVLYQIMPNLLGSNPNKDREMFEELFKDPGFQPDLLKIYPCALLRKSPLYKLWREKKYKPYGEKKLINLLKSIKKIVPYYVRIQRITRDIPSQNVIAGGAKISNSRQLLKNLSKKEGWKCKCIRCREVKGEYSLNEKICLFRKNYKASDGKEIFLSFENKDKTKLYSLLRLRITSKNQAIIREIHTYGQVVPLSKKIKAPQHRGLGKKLVEKAEKIARAEFGLKKISVISGIGVKNYFRKIGYKLENTYMVKNL